MKLPLSVFIIALNEADRIHYPINSVISWADEVIVIDSGSTDGTPDRATELGARVVYNQWPGYGLQKRFGEDQCRNSWILNLDADEEISPALAQEIQHIFADKNRQHSGYLIGMRDVLPGERKAVFFSYTKWAIRLYDRTKARFSDSPVHDSVIIHHGTVAKLHSPCLHYSFRSMTHAIEKLNRYSTVQSRDFIHKGKHIPTFRLYTEFFVAFIKIYVMRRYVFHGKQGFSYAMIYAFGRFIRLAKWYEAQKK